jgi:4-amino-4-deoxy-L-arabinose transferase-like glycosyltransferase
MPEQPHPRVPSPHPLIPLLALLQFTLVFSVANRYGIFRDELYYIACSRHLAWGYVDHPPLIAFITWLITHTLGTSLYALRLLPALAGAALVLVTAAIARQLGGGRFAQSLAAFAVMPVPIYLLLAHWLTMNAFEPLLWATTLWLTLRMVSRNDPRIWLLIGLLCGIGLENKYSMLFLIAGLLTGLLLSRQRTILRTPYLVAGAALAFLLVLPNALWLLHHHFPFLEFERHSRAACSGIERGPIPFLADQIILMNPLLAPLWLAGLAWLLWTKQAARFRFLGLTCLGIFTLLLLMKAKNYYLAPLYPALFAAGAVAFETATASAFKWTRAAYIAAVSASGLILAPFALPILSVPHFLAYQRAFHGFTPIRMENLTPALLPQQFADEFGWQEMVQKTAAVYNHLPQPERDQTAIFANDYGEAAAIDFFGPRYGLPPAISNHVTYWLWGPRNYTGQSVIVLGSNGKGDREHFSTVEAVAEVDNPYSRADEHFDIFLCRGLNPPLPILWPKIKAW